MPESPTRVARLRNRSQWNISCLTALTSRSPGFTSKKLLLHMSNERGGSPWFPRDRHSNGIPWRRHSGWPSFWPTPVDPSLIPSRRCTNAAGGWPNYWNSPELPSKNSSRTGGHCCKSTMGHCSSRLDPAHPARRPPKRQSLEGNRSAGIKPCWVLTGIGVSFFRDIHSRHAHPWGPTPERHSGTPGRRQRHPHTGLGRGNPILWSDRPWSPTHSWSRAVDGRDRDHR